MEDYRAYRSLKRTIKTTTDFDVLKRIIEFSEPLMMSVSPNARKMLALEAKMRIMQLKLSEAERISERYRLTREMFKLRELIRREKLHDKARWDFMIQATKYRMQDARYFITDTMKDVASVAKVVVRVVVRVVTSVFTSIAKGRRWISESLPPSFMYLGTWALTSRELIEWSKKRLRRSVKKPKIKYLREVG